jgi:hypothetical protein
MPPTPSSPPAPWASPPTPSSPPLAWRVQLVPAVLFLASLGAVSWLVRCGQLPPWSLAGLALWLAPSALFSDLSRSPELVQLLAAHHQALAALMSSFSQVALGSSQLQAAAVSQAQAPGAAAPLSPSQAPAPSTSGVAGSQASREARAGAETPREVQAAAAAEETAGAAKT